MSVRKIERKYEKQKRTVLRQLSDIERLEHQIAGLRADSESKKELFNSVSDLYDDLTSTIVELKIKSDEYDKLISELQQMKKVMNQNFFKGKWRLIRFLLR